MKIKELTDLRKKDINELKNILKDKKDDLDKINLDLSLGQESDHKKASRVKKDIAQIMTIVREKEIIEAESDQSSSAKKGDEK